MLHRSKAYNAPSIRAPWSALPEGVQRNWLAGRPVPVMHAGLATLPPVLISVYRIIGGKSRSGPLDESYLFATLL